MMKNELNAELQQVAEDARSGRRGIVALFKGASRTGKTMAARSLASRLGMQYFTVALGETVNKYIGETEKNLARMLDAAESSGSVLFIDEADALFGKRDGVGDSHDRYANIEVSHLLERMERFPGIVILATNRRDKMDAAFMRKIPYVLEFPLGRRTTGR